ncbi:hypothetical protein ES708_29097 [subsurface metagenome]
MEDNISERGNLELGLLPLLSLGQAYYAPHNDVLISYGLDESSPYIKTVKIFFYAYAFLWADTRSAPTYYSLLITHYLLLAATCFVTYHSLLITCYLSCYSLLITGYLFCYSLLITGYLFCYLSLITHHLFY